jgi:TonB family protein
MRTVPTAPSASRPEPASRPAASPSPAASQPAVDITALTTRDDFLLELGQTLGGQAAVRPVDTLESAIESMAGGKRAQLLVIDARDVPDVRAAVDAAHAQVPRTVVLVFAERATEKQLGSALKGSKVFAVLSTPIDARKTQAVVEGAIEEALSNKSAPLRPATTAQPDLTIGAFRPATAQTAHAAADDGGRANKSRMLFLAAAVAAVAVAATGGYWFYTQKGTPVAATAAPKAPATAAAPAVAVPAPAVETTLVQGKVDELLEKARLAMHERRFTEPAGDNALLYYRSAAAADPSNAEAHDGLQRVAAVLGDRFEDAVSNARFDEAALTLANFKAATPAEPKVASLELRLYSAAIARSLADGNPDRAAAYLHQAQSTSITADQLGKWRTDIARRQEDAKVTHLASLVEDRIRDGKLTDADDSAKSYLQQLVSAAPTNPNTQRVARDLGSAYLRKARDAALAKNSSDSDHWLAEARAVGMKPADIAAFQRDLTNARAKAAQAESERLAQLARDRIRDGKLTDPAQDSASYYLTQLQSGDPANVAVVEVSQDLAAKLMARAKASVLAGKSGDTDLALAKHWGASPQDLAAVQQLTVKPAATALDPASLAASLKRLRAPPPDYPQPALQRRVSGSVMLQFTVDAKGEPRDIHVIEATPPGVFDDAATAAVRHWRYAPMLVDGGAVEVPVKTLMRFELPKQN